MITLKKVNREILKYGYELVKGKGYFYFIPINTNFKCLSLGEDNYQPQSESVYVYRLNHLTLESWIDELKTKIENLRKTEED